MSRRFQFAMLLAVLCTSLFSLLSPTAQARGCPQGTVQVGTKETETPDAIIVQPVCQRVPTMNPMPETTMRAKTRAECVRDAGTQLKEDLGVCRSPIMACLATEGVPDKAADCVETALETAGTAALAKATATSRLAQAVVALQVERALRACNVAAKDIAKACAPAAGTCEEGPLKAHNAAIKACPAR